MALIDRVKFDGLKSRDWLIYKHPSEQLTLGTQLIVGEGQAAVFVRGGQVCDVFYAGSYTLEAFNLPLLDKLINLPFGGKTPFPAEIYYVNLTAKLDVHWGTPTPIQLIDPKYAVKLRVRAFGQCGLRIEDFMLFFQQIIGTIPRADLVSYDKVLSYYKGILITKIKTIIADVIINDKISALEITAHLDGISQRVQEIVEPEIAKFGFTLVNFFIQSINFPDEDFAEINKILEKRAAFELMGDNRYVTQRSFDVYETAAGNEGGVAGAFAAGGVGLGAGAALAGSVTQQLNPNAVLGQQQGGTNLAGVTCPQCHTLNEPGAKFCVECSQALTMPTTTCPKCGKTVRAAKFCSECGSTLEKRACEGCGAVIRADAKFCPECGKEQ